MDSHGKHIGKRQKSGGKKRSKEKDREGETKIKNTESIEKERKHQRSRENCKLAGEEVHYSTGLDWTGE